MGKNIQKYKYLYLMLLPGILWYVIYKYAPFAGLTLAFKDYNLSKGIWGSAWAGLKHFQFLFHHSDFYRIVGNTLLINLYNLLFGFPFPILLALLLNELRCKWFKHTIQTVIYFPHFLSWVIFGGIILQFLGLNEGIVNQLIRLFGGKGIQFMTHSEYFRPIVVGSGIIKEAGWGAIIYLAALSGVDPELYEAATIDRANRWQMLWHITLPSISTTIIVMLILKVGNMLDVGFEQIYILYNPSVYDVGDVLSTYIYRVGILGLNFSLTTAIGLFQSVIGFFLVVGTNRIAKKFSEVSIW